MTNKLSVMIIILVSMMLLSMKSDKPAYRIFDTKSKTTKYKNLIRDAKGADIVLFGELHNNPIAHWLQVQLTKDLFEEKGDNLVLGAEMFETDNQLLLDEYIAELIRENNFENEAKLWKNYSTDYKPLVSFAKNNRIPFIATNIPRRYASIVNQKGFEGLEELNEDALRLIAPLPVEYDAELPGYMAMMEMMGGMGKEQGNINFPKAQAIKDATMAHFILKNWQPGKVFLHFNGAYHSNNYEGIVWYLKLAKPELNIMTISTVEQDTINDLQDEHRGIADYIICIPSDMIKSY
jgi:uncharacterized iron-regulated protein